jgi:hypothetical protein
MEVKMTLHESRPLRAAQGNWFPKPEDLTPQLLNAIKALAAVRFVAGAVAIELTDRVRADYLMALMCQTVKSLMFASCGNDQHSEEVWDAMLKARHEMAAFVTPPSNLLSEAKYNAIQEELESISNPCSYD